MRYKTITAPSREQYKLVTADVWIHPETGAEQVWNGTAWVEPADKSAAPAGEENNEKPAASVSAPKPAVAPTAPKPASVTRTAAPKPAAK